MAAPRGQQGSITEQQTGSSGGWEPARVAESGAQHTSDPTPTEPPAAPSLPLFIDGRYRLEREIGAGGMGRVYAGRDERLDRPIAAKVVAARGDASLFERLAQEARITGALGHPNIVGVHDVCAFEGHACIVQELLEGEPLRAALVRGPLPPERAARIGVEIARGLCAAHGKGVVHCDLKPENVMLLSDGRVKLLDFGIARVVRAGQPAEALGPQSFAGTVRYSAPEQVRGQPVDPRADLFAFGVVLHEMLAGARPFEGSSRMEVAHKILQAEPAQLPAGVPGPLRKIVARCLQRDRDQRFQSARELLDALEPLADDRARVQRRRLLAAGVVGLGGFAAGAFGLLRRPPAPPRFEKLTSHAGAVWNARFAPDGRTVFYSLASEPRPRIYSLPLDRPASERLLFDDALLRDVTADGALLALSSPLQEPFDFRGRLAQARPGEALRALGEELVTFAAAGPGGLLALVRTVNGVQRLEYPQGNVLFQTGGRIGIVRVSRDGARVAFLAHPEMTSDGGEVMLAEGRSVRTLASDLESAKALAFSPDEREVWFTGERHDPPAALRAVSLAGEERLVRQESGRLDVLDVARDGRALVTQPSRSISVHAARDGQPARDLSFRDEHMLLDLSRDGSTALVNIDPMLPSGDGHLFVRKVLGGDTPRLIGAGYGGALSADASRALVFPWGGRDEPLRIFRIDDMADGQVVKLSDLSVSWAALTDRAAILVAQQAKGGSQLFALPLDAPVPRPLSPQGIQPAHPIVSPDGRWVALVDDKANLALYSTAGEPSRLVRGARPGERATGWLGPTHLLVAQFPAATLEVDSIELATGARARFRTLAAPHGATVNRALFSADGSVAAYSAVAWKTHLYLAHGLH